MTGCNACTRKCIRYFLTDVLDKPSPLRTAVCRSSPAALARQSSWTRRSYASVATKAHSTSQQDPLALMPHFSEHKRRAITDSLVFGKKELEQELRFLRDPLKLAENTISLLHQDQNLKALVLVRMVSSKMNCTVSWNHLVDYEMSKGRANSAVKLYNEMKKRAQLPDAQTFTILFRGLAMYPHWSQALPRALSLYESMYASNCPVRPSIIHTNALLKVCARAKDLDALYGVAAKLSTHGPGAPNNLTFTTILNAVRLVALSEKEEGSYEEKAERRRRAIMQGRRIWGEIIERWKKGDIIVDEEMVCSMGRLLLLGYSNQDSDDVFSLVEQTMGIQRQVSRTSHPHRLNTSGRAEVKREPEASDSSAPALEEPGNPAEEDEAQCNMVQDDAQGGEFSSVISPQISLARPGRNTLSMIIDACIQLQAMRAAQDYWGHLTDSFGPYKVAPDMDNCHMYLRLLRVQRASRMSVELVQEIKRGLAGGKSGLEPKTFRIALSACKRDTKNLNVLEHARNLIQIMTDSLETPDIKALESYLEVATHHEKRDWRSILDVARQSVLAVPSLKSILAPGDLSLEDSAQPKAKNSSKQAEEMINLMTRLVAAYDTASRLGEGQMSQKEMQDCSKQRNILTKRITAMKGVGKSKEHRGGEKLEREFNVERKLQGQPNTQTARAARTNNDDVRRIAREDADNDDIDSNVPEKSPADTRLQAQGGRKAGWKAFTGGTYRPSSIHESRKQRATTTERDQNMIRRSRRSAGAL